MLETGSRSKATGDTRTLCSTGSSAPHTQQPAAVTLLPATTADPSYTVCYYSPHQPADYRYMFVRGNIPTLWFIVSGGLAPARVKVGPIVKPRYGVMLLGVQWASGAGIKFVAGQQ